MKIKQLDYFSTPSFSLINLTTNIIIQDDFDFNTEVNLLKFYMDNLSDISYNINLVNELNTIHLFMEYNYLYFNNMYYTLLGNNTILKKILEYVVYH